MASGKGLISAALGRLFLKEATIARVELLGPSLRRFELGGESLRGASARPGDKVQVLLPTHDMRTLSPIGWDPAAGTCALIVHVGARSAAPAATPLQTWALAAAAGTAIRFFAPQRSLALPSPPAALVIVGDETSIGVAAAAAAAGHQVTVVLEVTGGAPLAPVLRALGLTADLIERAPGDAHYPELIARVAAASTTVGPGRQVGQVALTGRAQTIQAVRRALPRTSPAPKGVPYWSTGKRALD